jgi:hypothetical protein
VTARPLLGIPLPSTSPASLSWGWDDEDHIALSASTLLEPSSSQRPSLVATPWLTDVDELSLLGDSFLPAGEYSPGPVDPQLALEYWKDQESICQNTQKLFVSFSGSYVRCHAHADARQLAWTYSSHIVTSVHSMSISKDFERL